MSSDPALLAPEAVTGLGLIQDRIDGLSLQLEEGSAGLVPDAAAFDQAPWGVTNNEIPLLPMTSRGVLYDQVAMQAQAISKDFLSLRNMPEGAEQIIAETRVAIAGLKDAGAAADEDRAAYIKAVERIFRRLDDGVIFPADTMQGINASMNTLTETVDDSMGSLGFVEKGIFPGGAVIKTRTICIEQGSSRWLPKPLDVVAKLGQLSNPDLDAGGGYKGTRLLWWKWLPIANIVDFLIPDGLVDMLPGEYGSHNSQGEFERNYKDVLLAIAVGDFNLGSIPMLDGHIWDSLFRVLVALAMGILLGVPLGIYMGVSRFFKSFFDPLIELYRPVPPLAWAP